MIEYDDFGGKVIGGDTTASSSNNKENADIRFDDFGSQYVGDRRRNHAGNIVQQQQ